VVDRHRGRGGHPRSRPALSPADGSRLTCGRSFGRTVWARVLGSAKIPSWARSRTTTQQAGTTTAQTRRRGAELERAILDAAWEQLTAEGYEHFTIDTVAARARTSKPVLYRRWKTREDLLRETVRHRGSASAPPTIPDTGSVRGDLLALLALANTPRNPIGALVSSMLGGFYNQTGPTPAELREAFLSNRASAVEQVISRGVERGEIDPARLTPRIIDLPFALFRHEAMMTLTLVPDHVLRQIVDDIFLPLVTTQRPTR
jgi:AcrR family transcriptional regulator